MLGSWSGGIPCSQEMFTCVIPVGLFVTKFSGHHPLSSFTHAEGLPCEGRGNILFSFSPVLSLAVPLCFTQMGFFLEGFSLLLYLQYLREIALVSLTSSSSCILSLGPLGRQGPFLWSLHGALEFSWSCPQHLHRGTTF